MRHLKSRGVLLSPKAIRTVREELPVTRDMEIDCIRSLVREYLLQRGWLSTKPNVDACLRSIRSMLGLKNEATSALPVSSPVRLSVAEERVVEELVETAKKTGMQREEISQMVRWKIVRLRPKRI